MNSRYRSHPAYKRFDTHELASLVDLRLKVSGEHFCCISLTELTLDNDGAVYSLAVARRQRGGRAMN